ncbi:hypothetical protein AVEN_208281-1, partial [Araneus ventricosus]
MTTTHELAPTLQTSLPSQPVVPPCWVVSFPSVLLGPYTLFGGQGRALEHPTSRRTFGEGM